MCVRVCVGNNHAHAMHVYKSCTLVWHASDPHKCAFLCCMRKLSITMLEVFTYRTLVCSRSLSIHSQCPKSDSSWALNSDVVKRVSSNFQKLPLEVYSKIAVRITCTAVYKNLKLVLKLLLLVTHTDFHGLVPCTDGCSRYRTCAAELCG